MRQIMEPYKKFLSRDPKLKLWLESKIVIPSPSRNITMALVNSILAQQLSTRVAEVMRKRFLALFGNKAPKAQDILRIPQEQIKKIGISARKAEYIHNVAEFMVTHKVTNSKLTQMTDDEIIQLLSQIKGVGRWTVEMILIFAMKREDVFAVDDLGIQKAMIKIFKLHDFSKKDLKLEMMRLSERWSPYRSYVCLHFWNYSG
jgi:DNA-3-methyladenine glycosylase II